MSTMLQKSLADVASVLGVECQGGIIRGQTFFDFSDEKADFFQFHFQKRMPEKLNSDQFMMEFNPTDIPYDEILKAKEETTYRLEKFCKKNGEFAIFSDSHKGVNEESSKNTIILSTMEDPFAGMIQFSIGKEDGDFHINIGLIYVKPEYRHTSAWLDLTHLASFVLERATIDFYEKKKNPESMNIFFSAEAYSSAGNKIADIIRDSVHSGLEICLENMPEFIDDISPYIDVGRPPKNQCKS